VNLNPALCLGYFFILEFGFTIALRKDNVVPFVSVSKLRKEQHRQRSQKHTQEYRVCIPLERFLSGDCCSLERTQLKGMAAPRARSRIAKAKVITTRTSYEIHISFLLATSVVEIHNRQIHNREHNS
jgi:hypothetical protein